MVRAVRTVPVSGAFAWSPSDASETPLLATGNASGAVDSSFSNDAELQLWDVFGAEEPGQKGPLGSVKTSARFNRLAWGYVHPPDRPKGVIAAGFENGELSLYDPAKMLEGADAESVVIYKHTQHAGPVRGLDFNKLQPNLLSSGATNGEIFIWDLTNPQKPYSPGSRSRNLEDITSLAWNPSVAHVLATSSSSGYTVVWDLKGKREVVALNNAQANVNSMQGGAPAWMASGMPGSRRGGVSAVCWHPENPTKLVTASDDDLNPVIMLWDLRNAMAPERVLSGHEKGILGLSWCRADPDLLLSSSKDCRTLCWNPSTGEIVGELPASSNWAFQTDFCPRNPGMVATASFDGQIEVHTLQSTLPQDAHPSATATGADIFESGNLNAQQRPIVSLKQTPRWLRRPASASFGFGGKLVTAKSTGVRVQQIVTDGDLVERALRLETATDSGELASFCATRASAPEDATSWQLLQSLFKADSREELVTLLGFSKDEVKARVEEAIRAFKPSTSSERRTISRSASEVGLQATRRQSLTSESGSVAREPLVTFAETIAQQDALSGSSEGEAAAVGAVEATPSEASGISDATKLMSTEAGASESEITEPSLFGDEPAVQTPGQQAAAADFYSQIRSGRPAALPDHVFGHEKAGSSVAATIGSRPSSAASDKLSVAATKPSTFRIYPQDESEADRLLTRALVLGDFDSAVSLCLSSERYADAVLLAVRGGPELLARTQKAYFERRTTSLPYLRLFQSIVTNDLDDIVQNADLAEWQEIFVVLCTFAKADEFAGLAEQLGHRLEFQAGVTRSSNAQTGDELRKHAVLCYLAAGRLEKVVTIWTEEMKEQEQASVAGEQAASHASAHATALQSFIEKVTVFQGAVRYVDVDLAQSANAATGVRSYKLAPLYDRYREYAQLLAGQGLTSLAVRYMALTPSDYIGPQADLEVLTRLAGTTASKATVAAVKPVVAPVQTSSYAVPPSSSYGAPYDPYAAQAATPYQPAPPMNVPAVPSQYQPPPQQSATGYSPYNQFAPSPAQAGPYAPPPTQQNGTYDQYAQPSQQYAQPSSQPSSQYAQPSSFLPAPPPPLGMSPTTGQAGFAQSASAAPPPRRKAEGAWNDAPVIQPKRAGSAMGNRPGAIMSPFPNQQPMSPGIGASPQMPFSQPPPPSRGATRTPVGAAAPRFTSPPPPPMPRAGGQQFQSPPQPQQQAFAQPGFAPRPQGPPQQQFAQPPRQPGAPNGFAPQPSAPSPYDPPPGSVAGPPRTGSIPPGRAGPPQQFAPPPGVQRRQSMVPTPAPAPAPKPEPPKLKYPPGDRTHLTATTRPIFEILSSKVQGLKAILPPPQKRMGDDTERRLNLLFDLLNCEVVSSAVVDQVREIANAIDARNPQLALRLHLELLTTGGSKTDELAAWQTALKVLAQRCGEL